MTNNYTESPEAIKTDIERTRQNMTSKIDQIQARLHPDNLKAQAQETVRDIVRESTESLTSYFSENSKELGASVAQMIKSNPIPAALIGVGIGWLLVESYGGSHSSNQRYDRPSNDWQRNNWYPESEARYAGNPAGVSYATGAASSPFASQYQGASSQYQSAGPHYGSPQDRGSDSHPAHDRPGWVSEQASNLREQIGEKAEQLREGVQQVGEQMREQVGEWTDRIRSQSSSTGQQAEYYADQTRSQMSHMGEQMSHQVSHLGEQAQEYVQQTGQQFQRSLEDNPLVFGGVALAVGALIGMALPATRRENQMLGPWRDEVMHSAQEVANEAMDRAKQVAEEVRPQIEQTAQKVVSDLKQSGQSVLEDVKQTGKTALEDVKQTGRTALEETKQTGKDAAASAQQAVKETGEKAKQEANKLGDKASVEASKLR